MYIDALPSPHEAHDSPYGLVDETAQQQPYGQVEVFDLRQQQQQQQQKQQQQQQQVASHNAILGAPKQAYTPRNSPPKNSPKSSPNADQGSHRHYMSDKADVDLSEAIDGAAEHARSVSGGGDGQSSIQSSDLKAKRGLLFADGSGKDVLSSAPSSSASAMLPPTPRGGDDDFSLDELEGVINALRRERQDLEKCRYRPDSLARDSCKPHSHLVF